MLNVGGIRRARVQSGGMVMESQQAALAQPRRIVPFTCTEEDPSERLLTAQPLHSGLETGPGPPFPVLRESHDMLRCWQ